MADHADDNRACRSPDGYSICGGAGYYIVKFTSPYNSLHQIRGFKTEDDAKAWIAETQLLVRTY